MNRHLLTPELKALRSSHVVCQFAFDLLHPGKQRSGGVTWNLWKLSGWECELKPVGLLVSGSDTFGTKAMGTVDFSTQTVSWIRFCVFLAGTMVSGSCACCHGVQNDPAAKDRGLADEFSQKQLE